MGVREELLRLLARGEVEEFNEISRRGRDIVDLSDADLVGARLEGIDLRNACLDGAKLSKVALGGADLGGASMRYANLQRADLEGANLSKANLYSAYLGEANLRGALLSGADVSSAVFPDDIGAAEIELAVRRGTRMRHDPVPGLLRELLERTARGRGGR